MNRGDRLLYALERSVGGIHSAIGQRSTQQLKEHNAKRVDIRASIDRAAQYTFRGGIIGTSQEGAIRTEEVGPQ